MKQQIPLFSTGQLLAANEAAVGVLNSGQIASGPNICLFEAALGQMTGHSDPVTTSDMSAAIAIALRLADVGPGDEVIASPFACLSTNTPIALSGARIRWADVDPTTGAIDVEDVRRQIRANTKAIIVYHLAGYPGPADELATLCQDAGIVLIEDCDNALGAQRHSRPVGTAGDHAIYSFYPNRPLNGIEGGAIASRNPDATHRARCLRRFGIDPTRFRGPDGEISSNADVAEIGWSGSMNNLNAAVALAQIGPFAERLARTRANARRLEKELSLIRGVMPMQTLAGAEPSYWALIVRAERRDKLLTELKQSGIFASKLHQRNDRYSGFPADRRTLLGIDEIERTLLALPCGWWLVDNDLERIVEAVASGL